MKVAIIHYWLVGMRGGERVLEEFVRLYPDADIYTHVLDEKSLSPLLASKHIKVTSVSRLPGARKHYQKYLGFMPRALEELDLSKYDLVISSESGPAKGVIVPPHATHVCYVHSPMRYIWDHYPAYSSRLGLLGKAYFSRLAHRLRIWDVTTAARVDCFVANSNFVARRIRAYYNRDAYVVHPPVDLDAYMLPKGDTARDTYLFVSELVPYKRADLVIEAFRGQKNRRLIVVGDGSHRADLARDLPENVSLLGRVPGEDLPGLYQNARALIFPAEEDFGIVPVEAMACGTPVLAFGRGGARDSVIDGKTGLFFDRQDISSIRDVLDRFEATATSFVPTVIHAHACGFGAERFRIEFAALVEKAISENSILLKPTENNDASD